ncbi:MAG: ATP-binding protein [Sedimenticola sp.]
MATIAKIRLISASIEGSGYLSLRIFASYYRLTTVVDNDQDVEINPWTLRFTDPAMEQCFADSIAHSRLVQLRYALGLGAVLFVLYALLDSQFLPQEHLSITRIVTWGVIIPILLTEIAISFISGFSRIRIPFTIVGTTAINLVSIYVITKIGFHPIFYIELVLIVIWINVLSGFQLYSAVTGTLVLSLSSTLMVIVSFPVQVESFSSHAYIFGIYASASIGLLSAYLLERSAKYNYYYSEKLHAEVKQRELVEKSLITEKEKAESATLAKSKFLANMSHELRTPLNAILGFSEMLSNDPTITTNLKGKVDVINRSGDHLLAMINGVLDLSKIEAGRMELELEAFDLQKMLTDVCLIFNIRAEQTDLRFDVVKGDGLPRYLKADAGKLRQILINLLGNAVKYTQEGSVALKVRILPTAADPAMVTLYLEVEDSGPGISHKELQHIFEPFMQAGASASTTNGTGLGLAISQSFAKLMDGEIHVESALGKGSRFTVELPVVLADESEVNCLPSTKPSVRGLQPETPEQRILVVDDNADNRLLLFSMLSQTGFKVKEAENGDEAVALFKDWQPHLIWMDMRMPVMDGYEATAKIREFPGGNKVKIVALTASAFKVQRKKILSVGCDDLVHKPYQAHEIFDVMEEQLEVKYLYDESVAEETANRSVTLTTEMIEKLPPGLLEDLSKAATSLSIDQMADIVSRVRLIDEGIAEGLQQLTDDYQFRKIITLIGSRC